MPILSVKDLTKNFGGLQANSNINMEIGEHELVGLIGANGAGKTTTMRTIMGLIHPSEGEILFEGKDLTKLKTHEIVYSGISLVPEGRSILAKMTVLENLEMGAYKRKDKEVASDLEKVFDRFPILRERKSQLGGTLSGGQQQMLAIGRALMARPKLMLLDEPSMGLAPLVVADIFKVIKEINDNGTTVLLVEQNVRQAIKIADYAYVMETGKIVLEGTREEIGKNPRVMEAYLGGKQA